MDKIRNYIGSFELLDKDEIEQFLALLTPREIKKGAFFIKEGDIAKEVAFIESGIFRSFYYSSESEEVTYCFSFENSFIAGYSSYITQLATEENIQAITDTKILVISKSHMQVLENSSIGWLKILRLIAEDQYIKLEKRIFLLQKEDAEKRYQDLIENQPEYLQHIPLNLLASYLGISVRHLSRLRKSLLS